MPKASSNPPPPCNDEDVILRTKATEQYRLEATDLDSILPVSVNGRIRKYNVLDVKALDVRLNSARPHPSERAENGPQIHFYKAMKKYTLRPQQMYRIKPVSQVSSSSGKRLGTYNECDVQELSDKVKAAAASPAPTIATGNSPLAAGSSAPSSPTNPANAHAGSSRHTASSSRRAPRVRRNIRIEIEDDYEEPNMFDGLSSEDAAALLAQVCRW
ncbi:hypothetical protein B0H17DRAFT_231269 [Mycena rosella]|uniref:Uncharacterized protein n=1 Tax=Mycena rosella TaxID=1033263 RepID=A0AAD7MBJ9_MYCRO|nr:hypothetical protein B0H17DRAFT_231269 [Mycena rosella]